VTVTVGYRGDTPPPDLASEVDKRADARAARDVTVMIRFVQIQTT
jgi:hypothetical protein